jgi:hypothetical protein
MSQRKSEEQGSARPALNLNMHDVTSENTVNNGRGLK